MRVCIFRIICAYAPLYGVYFPFLAVLCPCRTTWGQKGSCGKAGWGASIHQTKPLQKRGINVSVDALFFCIFPTFGPLVYDIPPLEVISPLLGGTRIFCLSFISILNLVRLIRRNYFRVSNRFNMKSWMCDIRADDVVTYMAAYFSGFGRMSIFAPNATFPQ